MSRSLLSALRPRSLAQWAAVLGLIPFAIGATMQARHQREIGIAQMAVDQRLDELERRVDEVTRRAGTVGVRVEVTDSADTGSAPSPGRPAYDSLADGTRAIRAEAQALSREFDALTVTRERLQAQRSALRGVTAPANILLAVGSLITLAGVLTDIRHFRRRRAA